MIFLTGSSGFVGSSVLKFFGRENCFIYKRDDVFRMNSVSTVIHLAGKAQDEKETLHFEEYYKSNTCLTSNIFNAFLDSEASVFIALSSVKAVTDSIEGELYENHPPNPLTHYGKSKLLAEKEIFSKNIPDGKRVYLLRPCIIHGPGNKGNLNLLYKIASKGLPWPLAAFTNSRSFCSIDNLLFIIKELTERQDIPSGIYNIADDEPLSTNEIISLIAISKNREPKLWRISPKFINVLAKIGDILKLRLNSERLQKLTSSYVVSNTKIKKAIGKPLPLTSREGLLKTFKSFQS